MKNLKVATTIVALAATATVEAKSQPNIILVMCDDLGWGDVGFNGNEIIKTPNIDRMAREGVTFNRFYSACAVSSPTRASVLTGRNPFRTGVFTANAGILRPEEITIPELLREEGYATGHFGKWHLGSLTATEHDSNRGKVGNFKELNLPKEHGYDEAFVSESKVPTWDPMIRPVGRGTKAGWDYIREGEESESYGTSYWDIEGERVSENLAGDDSRIIMDRVLPFIATNAKAGIPTLSVVWFHAPHMPCVAGPEYAAMYDSYNDDFKNYAGCVTAMDYQMGRLRSFLEEIGEMDNTIILFCSDNGPENCSESGGGVTGGFRMRKRSLYEGGVRVPAFAFGAGVAQGIRSDFPAQTCDYLPTIMSMTKIKSSAAPNELDGVDITKVLRGKEVEREKPIVLTFNGQVTHSGTQYKLYVKGDKVEWYDIIADPYEKSPLTLDNASEQAESEMWSVIARYRSSFEGSEYGTDSYNRLEQSWNIGSKLER